MAPRAELSETHNVLSLCPSDACAPTDLGRAMLAVEKTSRLSLFAITGLLKDSEGSVLEPADVELVRQLVWQLDVAVSHASDLYWKTPRQAVA